MKNKIKRVIELKEGRAWIEHNSTTDTQTVYECLCGDLINKKINACTYIKSIKRVNLYNGYQKITVTYNNDCRAIYTIKN
jgi:hypothetical protein